MLFSQKRTTCSEVSKKGEKHYKIKYVYETDTELENSVELESENDKVESPEEVIKVKKGKWKIPQEKDVNEPVKKKSEKRCG